MKRERLGSRASPAVSLSRMDEDAVGKAERRVAEAEGMLARQSALIEGLRRAGDETGPAELALAIAERALELRQARLDALLSVAWRP